MLKNYIKGTFDISIKSALFFRVDYLRIECYNKRNNKSQFKKGAARAFAEEMIASATVKAIREEKGNLKYEYFIPIDKPDTILLIDSWENQTALDMHHASPMMEKIEELREKYDLQIYKSE